MIRKFRLKVEIDGYIIYQALYSLNEAQYAALLATYENEHRGGLDQTHVLEDLTGEPYDPNRDYLNECPVFVACMLICEYVDLFQGDNWGEESHILESSAATVEMESDVRGRVDWTCVPVE